MKRDEIVKDSLNSIWDRVCKIFNPSGIIRESEFVEHAEVFDCIEKNIELALEQLAKEIFEDLEKVGSCSRSSGLVWEFSNDSFFDLKSKWVKK